MDNQEFLFDTDKADPSVGQTGSVSQNSNPNAAPAPKKSLLKKKTLGTASKSSGSTSNLGSQPLQPQYKHIILPTSIFGNSPVPAPSANASGQTKAPEEDDKLNLLKLVHAALDNCGPGESIVLTKFKDDQQIKLRFGYNVGTQVCQKTIKAKGIKEAFVKLLQELIGEKTGQKAKHRIP